jgi:hypothetical protein
MTLSQFCRSSPEFTTLTSFHCELITSCRNKTGARPYFTEIWYNSAFPDTVDSALIQSGYTMMSYLPTPVGKDRKRSRKGSKKISGQPCPSGQISVRTISGVLPPSKGGSSSAHDEANIPSIFQLGWNVKCISQLMTKPEFFSRFHISTCFLPFFIPDFVIYCAMCDVLTGLII